MTTFRRYDSTLRFSRAGESVETCARSSASASSRSSSRSAFWASGAPLWIGWRVYTEQILVAALTFAMAIAYLIDSETPKNHGSLRPITVKAKRGTIVSAKCDERKMRRILGLRVK